MTQDDEQDKSLSDAELHDLGVRLLLAMLKSADTDTIAPKDWWRRGKAALQAGAGMSASLPQMASKMADKLEIEHPNKWTARELNSISSALDAHDQFQRFRSLCERDAFMMTSDAQVVREMERDKYRDDDGDEPMEDPFGLASEMNLPMQGDDEQ